MTAILFGFWLMAAVAAGAEPEAFAPVLSNHPDLPRPGRACPATHSREPLRYHTGQVCQEGRRLILDADSHPRAPGWLIAPPALRRSEGGWTIGFALDRPDDVEVRIVGPGGAVVRRLGCGVLGPNAPEPFRAGRLDQEVFWDGKDAAGRPAAGACRAEVRVGLEPKFERFVGYQRASVIPRIIALEVDPQGRLYLATSAENRSDPTLVRFGRDGEYLDMLYPPGPHQLHGRKLASLYRWAETIDGREVPTRARSWSQYIYQWPAGAVLPLRIGADGVGCIAEILTGWGSADVELTTPYRVFSTGSVDRFWFLQNITLLESSAALALDGKGGVYLAARTFDLSKGGAAFDPEGIGRIRKVSLATGRPDPAFTYNGTQRLPQPSALLGEPWPDRARDSKTLRPKPAKMPPAPTFAKAALDSPNRFVDIKDLAVDSHGRLLVVDSRPRRIKLYEPDGRFVGIIDRVAAHGSDERFDDIRALRVVGDDLYLLASLAGGPLELVKCRGALPVPRVVWRQGVDRAAQFLAVDASRPARVVWCGNGDGPGTLTRVVDEGPRPDAPRHFGGVQPRCFAFPCSLAADGEGRLFVYDRVRKKIVRTDDQGSCWKEIDAPFSQLTLFVDRAGGRLLATAPGRLACYDLELKPVKGLKFPGGDKGPWSTRSGGVLGGTDRQGNLYACDGLSDQEAKGQSLRGRIRRYAPDGTLQDAALADLNFSSGSVALDSRGNLYVLDLAPAASWIYVAHNLPCGLGRDGIGPARLMFRRGDQPVWEQSELCVLVKFGPQGGRRNSPAELWSHRGFSPHSAGGCRCDWPRGILAVDAADRIFGADAIHHHVKVLDTAGNLVARLGWWGNAETVPSDGDARRFGFWNIYALAAAGEALYVSDKDLRRIAKFRMDYREVSSAGIPAAR